MKNRLAHLLNDEPPWPAEIDYWEVVTTSGRYCISPETSQVVATELARRRPPRLLHFVDMFGAAVLVRTKSVQALVERTAGPRDAEREFRHRECMEEMREIHEEFRDPTDDWPDWDDDDGDCLT